MLAASLRTVPRKMGLGRAYVRARQFRELGVRRAVEIALARRRYLIGIQDAAPISTGDGDLAVHMLLQHGRVYEGLWAFYSLASRAAQPLRFVVHDDGSLTEADTHLLSRVFPGCRVISRRDADRIVTGLLEAQGLERCARFRRSFILGLKLLDIPLLAQSREFIVLDSDVLFFAPPRDLLEVRSAPGAEPLPRYSLDCGFAYSQSTGDLRGMLGRSCIERCNTGILRLSCQLDLERIERYLASPGFWSASGRPDWYAEQTLYAMELTRLGATPLPATYRIAPEWVDDPELVSGHYCGGAHGRFLYYRRAIPRLFPELLSACDQSAKPDRRVRAPGLGSR